VSLSKVVPLEQLEAEIVQFNGFAIQEQPIGSKVNPALQFVAVSKQFT
jgi:hypothetical protein